MNKRKQKDAWMNGMGMKNEWKRKKG